MPKAKVTEDYATIYSMMWHDPKFRALSESGQLAFCWLLSNSNRTMLGVQIGNCHSLSEHSHIREQGFQELIDRKMLAYDAEFDYVFVRNWAKYHRPNCPNQVKALWKVLRRLPKDSDLVGDALCAMRDVCKEEDGSVWETFCQVFGLPVPPEKEKKPRRQRRPKALPEAEKPPALPRWSEGQDDERLGAVDEIVKSQLCEEEYSSWFDGLKYRLLGEVVLCKVPTSHHQDWMSRQYSEFLAGIASAALGKVVSVVFVHE